MFIRTVDVIEEQTKTFWSLSHKITGRSKEKITVESAIKAVNDLEFNLGPQRPLLKNVKALSDVIIQGKAKKSKKSATISIIKFVGGTNA